MKVKKKICSSCGKLTFIWKNQSGERYCKYCWSSQQAKQGTKKPTMPIRAVSSKRKKKDEEYSKLRKRYLEDNHLCKVNVADCTNKATDVHHTYAGSNRDTYYLIQSTWIPVCRNCHNWIHSNPQEARILNYLK
jgi:hypothetical protein